MGRIHDNLFDSRLSSFISGKLGFSGSLLILALVISYLISSLISAFSGAPLMMDEVFSVICVRDVEWTNIIDAVIEGPNQAPPLYFFYLKIWGSLFGWGIISLKISAVFPLLGAIFLNWLSLKKFVNRLTASLIVISIWATSELLIFQAQFIRFYSLYLLWVSLAIFLHIDRTKANSVFRWLLIFITHTSMVYTFYLGALVSLLIFASAIVTTRSVKRCWCELSAIIVAGICFSFWIPNLFEQNPGGTPSWLFQVGPLALVDIYAFSINPTIFSLCVILILLVRAVLPPEECTRTLDSVRTFVVMSLLLPILLWFLMASGVIHLFWDRYLISVLMAYPLVLMMLFRRTRLNWDMAAGRTILPLLVAVAFFVSSFPILHSFSENRRLLRDNGASQDSISELIEKGAMVVTDSYRLFLRYGYPLNSEKDIKFVSVGQSWVKTSMSSLIGEEFFLAIDDFDYIESPMYYVFNRELTDWSEPSTIPRDALISQFAGYDFDFVYSDQNLVIYEVLRQQD